MINSALVKPFWRLILAIVFITLTALANWTSLGSAFAVVENARYDQTYFQNLGMLGFRWLPCWVVFGCEIMMNHSVERVPYTCWVWYYKQLNVAAWLIALRCLHLASSRKWSIIHVFLKVQYHSIVFRYIIFCGCSTSELWTPSDIFFNDGKKYATGSPEAQDASSLQSGLLFTE